jgi:hypothetical protein
LNALGINFDLEAAAFELKQLWGTAVAVLPTSVERLRHFGECHVGKAHRHAQLAAKLGGKPRVLVPKFEGKARRVVLVTQKPVMEAR